MLTGLPNKSPAQLELGLCKLGGILAESVVALHTLFRSVRY
jgi:hypothetical protein